MDDTDLSEGTEIMEKERFDFEQYSQELKTVFAEHADEIAISCLQKNHKILKISFGVLLRWIEDFKIMKEKLGLRDGDRVLVLADGTLDAFVTFLVVSVNHLTAVMADAAIPDGELLPLIEHCRVSAIFADGKNSEKMLETQQAPVLMTYGLRSCGRLLSEGSGSADRGEPTPDAVAILFSSGTTAKRKSVELNYASIMITHRKIRSKGVLRQRKPGRPMLEVFPMSHVSGLYSAYTLLNEGMNIAMVEALSSDTILEAFKNFKPMAFGMVPKVNDLFIGKFEDELKKKHLYGAYSFLSRKSRAAIKRSGSLAPAVSIMKPFRSLLYNDNFSCLFSGGASGTFHTHEAVQNMGIAYLDLYASTECGVYIASTDPADTNGEGSVGNILNDPYTETIINKPDADGIGEIYVRTDQIMNGYYRDPEKTADSFDGEYFKTGDLGRIDADGYLYITGRIKESIVMPNGAKVAPADLENLLAPVMGDEINYAVAGVPSPEDGADRIHLFIEKGRMTADEQQKLREEILSFQYKAMNQYRISEIHFMDEIPVTSIGKPKRYLLKEYALRVKEQPADQQVTETGAAVGPEAGPVPGAEAGASPEQGSGAATKVASTAAAENTALDPAEVEEKVFRIVKEVSKYEKELTGLEDFKDDLGMDSLSVMEMCTMIESEFSVSVGAYISVIPNAREMTDYILDPIFQGLVATEGNKKKKFDAYKFPVKRSPVHRALFDYFRRWSRRSLDFRVEGLENIEAGKQYIFCPNHQTHFDGLFVWSAMGRKCPPIDRFGCMAKAEHLDNPVTSLMMKTLGGIPVDRSGNIIESTQRAINYIKEGNSFLIHPEGTRTRDGKLGPFKDGAAKMALDTGMTIIPVAIDGGYEIWSYDRTLPQTRDKATGKKRVLKITFCPEVQTIGRQEEEITAEVRESIRSRLSTEA